MRESAAADYFTAFGRLCTLVGQALHNDVAPSEVLATAQRKGNSAAPWATAIRDARWRVERAQADMEGANVPPELIAERTAQIRNAIAEEWHWKEGCIE